MGKRFGRAWRGVDFVQPAAHGAFGVGQGILKAAAHREKAVRHAVQRIAVIEHILLDKGVVHRLRAVIHSQHRAHIGVNHETGQGAQYKVEIVGVFVAAFGVGHGHNAVDILVAVGQPGQLCL